MSYSNQGRDDQPAVVARTGDEVAPWRRDLSVPVPAPDRATRVASWVGWHLMELTGVTVPAAVAVAVAPWAWLVSGVVGAGWAVHEIRTATEQARLRTELNARTTPANRETSETDPSGVDELADGPDVDPEVDPAPGTDSTAGGAA